MKLEAYFAETAMRVRDYRPARRRALRWPRLLARFNYREPRRQRGGRA